MDVKGAATLAVIAGVLATGTVLAVMLPTEEPATVNGRVQCLSGRSVTGIWVEATNGGSDWASDLIESVSPDLVCDDTDASANRRGSCR